MPVDQDLIISQHPNVNALRLLACWLIVSSAIASEWSGQSEAAILSSLGTPADKASFGHRSIYQWPDREVVVIDGIVINVCARKPNSSDETVRQMQEKFRKKGQTIATLRAQIAQQLSAQTAAPVQHSDFQDRQPRTAEYQQKSVKLRSFRPLRASLVADVANLEQEQHAAFAINANRHEY